MISADYRLAEVVSTLPPADPCPHSSPARRRRAASSLKKRRSSSACRAGRCTTGFNREGSAPSIPVADRSASCSNRSKGSCARPRRSGRRDEPQSSSSPRNATAPAVLFLSRETRGVSRRIAPESWSAVLRHRRSTWRAGENDARGFPCPADDAETACARIARRQFHAGARSAAAASPRRHGATRTFRREAERPSRRDSMSSNDHGMDPNWCQARAW